MKKLTTLIALCAVLATSGVAQAALVDRGGGLIYDTGLNITWLKDANYAKTSGYDADGAMTWSQATTWAANLSYYDSARGVTYNDWRLPSTGAVNGTALNYSFSYNGSTDFGYNVSAPGTAYAGSTGSEMAYLFYNTLNNKSIYSPALEYQADFGLRNTGPFSDISLSYYWSGTEYAPNTNDAWYFYIDGGSQGMDHKASSLFAWAVRDGDIAAVPVPAAWLLLGSGLMGLIGVARRKTNLHGELA